MRHRSLAFRLLTVIFLASLAAMPGIADPATVCSDSEAGCGVVADAAGDAATRSAPVAGNQRGSDGAAMFRGDPAHQGVVDTAGVDILGAIAWRFETGSAVRSSPTLHGGTLFIGSSDHHLYALDAADGQQLWRYRAAAAVTSSAAVDSARVIFADRAGSVYALDRRDGTLQWKVTTGAELPLPWGHEGWDYFTASPTLVDDTVYVGAGDGVLYALDAGSGTERWRFDTGCRIRSTPAVADGLVLFGNADGIFYALDAGDGAERWRFETAGHAMDSAAYGFDRRQVYSSAAVHDGVVYFGSRDALLYALAVDDGREMWRSGDGTSAWVISSPAVRDDVVYSARSSSTRVRALSAADGSEIWSRTTDHFVFSSPVIAGETLFVANAAGWVMAFETGSGELRWRYRTGGGIWGTPAVADGRLYIGSDDGFVYAFEHTDGPAPRRAVFWQEDVPFSSLGLGAAQRRILEHFEYYGYETLSPASLADFMRDRVADGAPSVIVFAMDRLPPDVVERPFAASLLLRYLEAGGKVVWMGAPPSFYVYDADRGQVTGLDAAFSSELLGVDTSDYRDDLYPVEPTDAGRRWGLSTSWIGRGGFPDEGVQVLARDELGRVACWARSYGGGPGTGFVFIRPAFHKHDLDEVRAVAEYGVLRRS